MSSQQSSRVGGRVRPFIPRIEALEERTVPVANFHVSNHFLLISMPTVPAGQPATRITVTDNGSNNVNNVRVSANGTTFRPNVSIHRVQFLCGNSTDQIAYNFTGQLTGNRTVHARLGRGQDSFQMTVRRNIVNANLNVNVQGGNGGDFVSMTVIGDLIGAGLNFTATGGSRNDSLLFTTTNSVNVDPDSNLSVNLEGAGGNDLVRCRYSGELDSSFSFNMDGGPGNDQVGAAINVASFSTGRLFPSRVMGGPGDDNLTFLVRNFTSTAITLNQVLDGGAGINSSLRTNDVIAVNISSDTVID